MIAIGNYCMSAEITHVPKKNSEGTRKKRGEWMMSERIGSHGWRIWKEKGLPQEVVPLSDAEGVVKQLETESAKLSQAVNDKDQELFESQELVGELLEALEAFVKVHHDDNVDICRDAGVSPSGCDCAECIRGEKAIRNAKEK